MPKRRTPRTTIARRPEPSHAGSAPIELAAEKLRWRCLPGTLGVRSMDAANPAREIIGQDRAVRALHVGLEMLHSSYNIFVTGDSGTGRTTTTKRLLREYEQRHVELTDKCYVHNFHDPDTPLLITLPAGKGTAFRKDMETLVSELKKAIPGVFESRRFQEQRKGLLEHFQNRQRSVLKDFEKKVKDKGFEVVQVQTGPGTRPEIAPVIDGAPVTMEQLQAKVDANELSTEQMNAMLAEQTALEGQMDLVMREMRNIERKAKKSLDELSHNVVEPIVEELVADIASRYAAGRMAEYLAGVKREVLDHVQRFQSKDEQPQNPLLGMHIGREEDAFLEFQVNVIVDNSAVSGVPIIIETNPRYKNLFGTIERVVDRNGVWRTDFTQIHAGSLLKADGGCLVVNALDALVEPGVWTTLKRVLRNQQIEIQPPESGLLGASSALKPEPVRLNVKVIMIGDPSIYHVLYGMDDDFKKIFKIRADFDTEMRNDEKGIGSYVSFVKSIYEEEALLPFDLPAVAEVIEYGVRLAGNQGKLSTHFNLIADVLREASYWARRDQARVVTNLHVQKAIDERIERVRMTEEKLQEMMEDGTILIATEGMVVGQVNGLSVYQNGEHAFGKPTRITAKTAIGRAGIINIEREADLSGPSHDKGVLILAGYLRSMYAQNKPLMLSASVAFEQSYGGVDGDSASSTEVYALLSSLSGLPLRQDLAVTGSINQHGEIQPIGGVNLKIEGFFDVCNARGLTGSQGVLIPAQNVPHLMLRHDVVQAVKQGRFHVYAVRTVDEGISLLTGKPAGTCSAAGVFPRGTVHALVDRTLDRFRRSQKDHGT